MYKRQKSPLLLLNIWRIGPSPQKFLKQQLLIYDTVLFPTLSPYIAEKSVLLKIFFTGHYITTEGLLSIDEVGTNLLMLPRTCFTVKKTNFMKNKLKSVERNLGLQIHRRFFIQI